MSHDETPVSRALGAVSDELDAIGDALAGQSGVLAGIRETQEADGRVLRQILAELGRLRDDLGEVPELRRRVGALEERRHLDAE